MKKGVSIIFSIVLLLSGAHFTVATHFCGGEVAARRITLSGKLASCGMENIEGSCKSTESNIKGHCCDNKTVTIGIINNFNAPVSIVYYEIVKTVQHCYIPFCEQIIPIQNNSNTFDDSGPPGEFSASAVNLNDICIFRI